MDIETSPHSDAEVAAAGKPDGAKRRRRRRVLAIGGVVAVGLIVFVLLYFEPQTAFIDDKVSETLPGLDVALAATTVPAGSSVATESSIAGPPTTPAVATPETSTAAIDAAPAISSPDAAPTTVAADVPATAPTSPTTAPSATAPPTTAPPTTTFAPNSLTGSLMTARDTGQPVIVSTGTFISGEHDTSGTALVVALPDGSIVVRFEDLDTSNGPDLRVVLSTDGASDAWKYDGRHILEGLKGNLGDQNYTIPADVDLAGFRSVVIWCERFSVAFGAASIDVVA